MRVPLTVRDFIDRAELVYGDRIGLVDEPDAQAPSWGAISYRELARRVRAFAAGLDALGIAPGERVAIVSPNSARFVAALYGTCGSGRILVPINFRLHAHEVEYIVSHSGARVLLVDPELEDSLREVPVEHRIVLGAESDELLLRYDREPAPVELHEDHVATLNYTSGTTARPKGVQLTHRSLWLNATTFGWHVGIGDRDRFLHLVPLFHVNGWGMPFALACMGATQVMQRKVSGAEILRRVQEHGITITNGAPAVVHAVLDAAAGWEGPIPGGGRTRIIVAGAPPPTRTIERVETELGWELIQIYGLTETSPLLTINRGRAEYDALEPALRAARLGRAGAPVLGVRVRIDELGEVLARANVVTEGYWQDPPATAAAIVDGWFHTGDGGTMDDEGYVTISDRKKDVIISGGENVSSIEVEDCLSSHPDVAEVAVIGVPDDKWGETVKALVVLRPGAGAGEVELIAHCRAHLAHYKCPTSVELRNELPRTATGKLQKFVLRAPYWKGRSRQVG
ncbi:MAG: AMP-binding protein [Myxococcales bacterium]|nr:AMP-binding protein [Myxococcales bacterium]MCB9714436.1 AMP-binding protein [Myxococcales bacterium]